VIGAGTCFHSSVAVSNPSLVLKEQHSVRICDVNMGLPSAIKTVFIRGSAQLAQISRCTSEVGTTAAQLSETQYTGIDVQDE
jgi:hypothetical protein